MGLYLGKMGYVFSYEQLEECSYNDKPVSKPNFDSSIAMGVDIGWGSSAFAITILQNEDGIIKTLYAKQFEKAQYQEMLNLIIELKYRYKPQKVYCDGSSPEFIKSLKVAVNENPNYEQVIEQARHNKIDIDYRMNIVPIGFGEWGRELLGRLQHIIARRWFSLSAVEHKDLLVQLRMARFAPNGNLDKSVTSGSTYDLLDSTRLAMAMFEMCDKR
jgi:hypothetical protein